MNYEHDIKGEMMFVSDGRYSGTDMNGDYYEVECHGYFDYSKKPPWVHTGYTIYKLNEAPKFYPFIKDNEIVK